MGLEPIRKGVGGKSCCVSCIEAPKTTGVRTLDSLKDLGCEWSGPLLCTFGKESLIYSLGMLPTTSPADELMSIESPCARKTRVKIEIYEGNEAIYTR